MNQKGEFMKKLAMSLAATLFCFSGVTVAQNIEPVASDYQSFWSPSDIIEPNSLEPIENVRGTPYYIAGRSVARASLDGYCSSFRIAKDLFMTNNHCFIDTNCTRTTFTLAYEAGVPENERPVFQCKEIVVSHFMLDYAVVRVEEKTNRLDSLEKYPPAVLSREPAMIGAEYFIIGHPKARKKEIDRSVQCTGIDTSFDTLYHACDSEEGSSGAPIFDKKTNKIVAINWGGGVDQNAATMMSSIVENIKEQLGSLPF